MEPNEFKELLVSIISHHDFYLVRKDAPRYKDINPKKWYIADLRKPHKPRAYGKSFESKKQTQWAIDEHYGAGIPGYFPAKGSELIEFAIALSKGKRITKYKFFKSYTRQKKHEARIKARTIQRKSMVEGTPWNPKSGVWVFPPDIKTAYQKHLYRVRIRKQRIRNIARES